MRRKPNVEQRRRDLCDAAIELLAADGARGVTHLRVDRRAGVADGTSFYSLLILI
jgi:DNA-binding transcriptional regulator YbjK